jgi:predicted glycosyltransferase
MKKVKLSEKDRIVILRSLDLYAVYWQDHHYEKREKTRIEKLQKRLMR